MDISAVIHLKLSIKMTNVCPLLHCHREQSFCSTDHKRVESSISNSFLTQLFPWMYWIQNVHRASDPTAHVENLFNLRANNDMPCPSVNRLGRISFHANYHLIVCPPQTREMEQSSERRGEKAKDTNWIPGDVCFDPTLYVGPNKNSFVNKLSI